MSKLTAAFFGVGAVTLLFAFLLGQGDPGKAESWTPWRVLLLVVLVGGLSIGVAFLFNREYAVKLRRMRTAADEMVRGKPAQFPIQGQSEAALLAESLNHLAGLWQQRTRQAELRGIERDAVLESLTEGVLILAGRDEVVSVNQAAARMMSPAGFAKSTGPLSEAIADESLKRFVLRAAATDDRISGELVSPGRDKALQLRGAPLKDVEDHRHGTIVLINDLTRIYRLEHVRRDFVANVSHQLRTPITAVKGFAETLLDKDLKDAAASRRFLRIIVRHADSLNRLVEELLDLSRMEQLAEESSLSRSWESLQRVLRAAILVCQEKHGASDRVRVDCPESLRARINAPLLEQALVNLIDNALSYSAPDSPVDVTGSLDSGRVILSIRDRGIGIEKGEQARVFERFYRVQSQNRREGTGLGLSITKHIVKAHRGRLELESEPGIGSTFRIEIPRY